MTKTLVAVLHSLPATSGARTRDRVDLARRTLGCSSVVIANLYPAQLAGVTALHSLESAASVWAAGRQEISSALAGGATDVLLGFGVQTPNGVNRAPYVAQLQWLRGELAGRQVRLWGFGRRPAHPSRWQRLVHREQPGGSLELYASTLLQPVEIEECIPPH